MAEIGDRHFAKRASSDTATYATLRATQNTDGQSVNALSIAQFNDIPRETVRRKIANLVDRAPETSAPPIFLPRSGALFAIAQKASSGGLKRRGHLDCARETTLCREHCAWRWRRQKKYCDRISPTDGKSRTPGYVVGRIVSSPVFG